MVLASTIIILVILIFMSAFFSIVEASFLSISSVKVITFLHEKKFGAKTLSKLKEKPQRLIISMLVGNTIVNFSAVSIATAEAIIWFPEKGIPIATFFMTVIVLFFAQITPKLIADKYSEKIALIIAKPADIIIKILFPVVLIFEKTTQTILKHLNFVESKMSDDEFKTVVSMGTKEGVLHSKSAEMIKNILDFEETSIKKIMTRKEKILILKKTDIIKDVTKLALKSNHSRFPVIDKRNKIAGIISLTDLLKASDKNITHKKISTILQKPFIIPDTKDVEDLMFEFENKHIHLAIVVNEFGSIIGLITLQDILKKVIGHFENDTKQPINVRKIGYTEILGNTTIEEVNSLFKTKLKSDKVKTIAGYIENKLQKIPLKNEKIKIGNLSIIISNSNKQKINKIKIMKSN